MIMSVELEQVRSRLMVAEKQVKEPPPLLLQLQQDMGRMKVRNDLRSHMEPLM